MSWILRHIFMSLEIRRRTFFFSWASYLFELCLFIYIKCRLLRNCVKLVYITSIQMVVMKTNFIYVTMATITDIRIDPLLSHFEWLGDIDKLYKQNYSNETEIKYLAIFIFNSNSYAVLFISFIKPNLQWKAAKTLTNLIRLSDKTKK